VHSHHPQQHTNGTRCKQHHAAADRTIPLLWGVILADCVHHVFGKTSLALVLFKFSTALEKNLSVNAMQMLVREAYVHNLFYVSSVFLFYFAHH